MICTKKENNPEYYSKVGHDILQAARIDQKYVLANLPEDLEAVVNGFSFRDGLLANIKMEGSSEFSVEMKLTWDLRSDTFKGL